MATLISSEDCVKILKNYLGTLDNVKYISHQFKSISNDLEGFLGQHNKLVINFEAAGEQKSAAFFVKNKPNDNKIQLDLADAMGVYKKEIFFYEILLKEFEKYGYDTSFAGKSYHCIPDQLLVMEDLTLNGYSITDRHVDLTVNHLKSALKSLAKYHAAGYALERTKSKELNRNFNLGEEYEEYMFECSYIQYIDQSSFMMKWWDNCIKTVNTIIDLLPQDESYKQEFKELLEKAELSKAFATETNINKTCGHGDLWSNNMLFKYKNNQPENCCLVDFQICRYFYPCMDVLLSIFCNTNLQFREQHLQDLFLYYHQTLSEILKKYGYNVEEIHPLQDFYDSIKLVKVEVLIQNLFIIIVIQLPKSLINDLAKDEAGLQEILYDTHKLAAVAFKDDETYRKLVIDTLFELRDELIKRCQAK